MRLKELLILDEADRLLDLGFKNSINNILAYLPRQRRTGLFSATQTKEVIDLVRAGLRNPVLVTVKEKASISTPVRLQNFYKIVEADEKFLALVHFLRSKECRKSKVMVFLPTCACVEYWGVALPHFLQDHLVLALHGKMKNKRNSIIERFRSVTDVVLLCTDVLARGLDVPEIEWVVQWDPPANASSFVHRVGRTARQGNEGNSLVFLLPNEDAYVGFLKINQKVDLNPLHSLDYDRSKLPDFLQTLHRLQLEDRAVFDKAVRAFVSHIRAYSKHECNAILRLKDMDLGKAATSYGLLQMPRMPELKKLNADNFIGPSESINIKKLIYKNAQKEQSRQNKLKTYEKTGIWPGKKKFKKATEAWEQSKKAKEESKNKKQLRKARKMARSKQEVSDGNKPKRKRKPCFTQEELEELANDCRLFKKLRKNKITEEEFNEAIGFDENS